MPLANAVVLALSAPGGRGWPALGSGVPELFPVANRPVLFHHLDGLAAAGIRHAAIVADHAKAGPIRAAVGDGSEWGMELTYVDHGAANVLASAAVRELAGSGPLLVHHGDVLLRDGIAAMGSAFAEGGMDGLILRSDEAATGYILGERLRAAIRAGADTLDVAMERLLHAGARISVRHMDACLPCRGGTDALLASNRWMLDELPHELAGERLFGTEIQGRVTIDPSAEIHDSLIRGPVVIGPRTRIMNAYIGPYTSIGAGVRIDSAEIEHSIVLDGAQLRFAGMRLEGSLIGPDAQIVRDFRLPQAIRLSVGAGAQVSLA